MPEETNSITLEKWEDLPLKVRRNRKHMYNYIKNAIDPEPEE